MKYLDSVNNHNQIGNRVSCGEFHGPCQWPGILWCSSMISAWSHGAGSFFVFEHAASSTQVELESFPVVYKVDRSAECDFLLRVLILQCTFVVMCKSCCCCFVVFIISVLIKVWMTIARCRKWFKLLLCSILTSPGPILNTRVIVLIVHQDSGIGV